MFCSRRFILSVTCFQAAHAKAEKKLQDERTTLSRFDNELKELANVIKEKKQAVSQAELDIKSHEHAVQVLSKEKATAVNTVANLEKRHEWIVEDKEYATIRSWLSSY